MSSTVIQRSHTSIAHDGALDSRNAHRSQGWILAISASVALWSGIGAAVWSVVSYLN